MTSSELKKYRREYMRRYRKRAISKEYTRLYQHRPKRKEYMRDYCRAYYHRPEVKEQRQAYKKRRAAEYKAYYAEYREKHKEHYRKTKRLYRLTHPETIREISKRQRRIRRSAEKANMLAQIISAVPNLKCSICGKRMPFKDRTIDHVIPLSKGGTGDVWNLQIVHMRCNQKKSATMPDELNFAPHA